MSCTRDDPFNQCRIFKHYISSGKGDYHGEICTGCFAWIDLKEDIDFKSRVQLILDSAANNNKKPG